MLCVACRLLFAFLMFVVYRLWVVARCLSFVVCRVVFVDVVWRLLFVVSGSLIVLR